VPHGSVGGQGHQVPVHPRFVCVCVCVCVCEREREDEDEAQCLMVPWEDKVTKFQYIPGVRA